MMHTGIGPLGPDVEPVAADTRAQRRTYRGLADSALGQIHFKVCGRGHPLLLCHQAPSSLRQFDAVYPLLADAGIMAIGVDAPGFGNSDVPDHAPTIAEYADAVTAVLDHMGIEVADILGQHTGSAVALEAVLRAPSRYRRLILNSPTPFTAEERHSMLEAIIPRQRAWQLRADGTHLLEMWNRRIRATGPSWTNVKAMHRNVVQMLVAGETLWHGHNALLQYDFAGRIMQVTHRCLVLANTGDVRYAWSLKSMRMRPDFEYHEIGGGSHDIMDEAPAEWTQAVAEFVNAQ